MTDNFVYRPSQCDCKICWFILPHSCETYCFGLTICHFVVVALVLAVVVVVVVVVLFLSLSHLHSHFNIKPIGNVVIVRAWVGLDVFYMKKYRRESRQLAVKVLLFAI